MSIVHSANFDFLCAVLRGDAATWQGGCDDEFTNRFGDLLDRHGVRYLFGYLLTRNRIRCPGRERLIDSLARQTRLEAMMELRRKVEIMRILDRLAAENVHPLLLKGTPLAYSYYEHPFLRTRGDTDLFIREADRAIVDTVFRQHDYRQPNAVTGQWVSRQTCYVKSDCMGTPHTFDVHWAISNSLILARTLTFDDCLGSAAPVPPLGDHARTLSAKNALALACVHRAAHMHTPYFVNNVPFIEGNRLIWLYDVHLLVNRMSQDALTEFAYFSKEKRIAHICRDALFTTQAHIGTPIHSDLLGLLDAENVPESSACYLRPNRANVRAAEFRSIPGVANKLRYLFELTFPPRPYMLKKYNRRHGIVLPLLYLRRAAAGTANALSQAYSGITARR